MRTLNLILGAREFCLEVHCSNHIISFALGRYVAPGLLIMHLYNGPYGNHCSTILQEP